MVSSSEHCTLMSALLKCSLFVCVLETFECSLTRLFTHQNGEQSVVNKWMRETVGILHSSGSLMQQVKKCVQYYHIIL